METKEIIFTCKYKSKHSVPSPCNCKAFNTSPSLYFCHSTPTWPRHLPTISAASALLKKVLRMPTTWTTWGSPLLRPGASLWALGGVRGGGQAALRLSRVFSDDSCFGVWVCGFYGQLPGWWGSWELAPFSSPSRCSHKINTPRLPHPTQVSLQTDSRDWAPGVVTHGPQVSSLWPNRTPWSSSSFYVEGPLGCQSTLCFWLKFTCCGSGDGSHSPLLGTQSRLSWGFLGKPAAGFCAQTTSFFLYTHAAHWTKHKPAQPWWI